jgi:hypothetical protein
MKLLTPKGWVNLTESKQVSAKDYEKKDVYSHMTHDSSGDAGKMLPKKDHMFVKNNKPVHTFKGADGEKNEIFHHPDGHTLHVIHDEEAGEHIARFSGHHNPKDMEHALKNY